MLEVTWRAPTLRRREDEKSLEGRTTRKHSIVSSTAGQEAGSVWVGLSEAVAGTAAGD